MATIRLVPSTYYLSNSSYLSVSNVDNMYTNTDSTTHGTVTHTRASTNNTYYMYLRGFNFSDVPSDAEVSGFTVKIKASATGHTTSTSSSYYMSLYNGTTAIGSTSASGRLSTTLTTFTFAEGFLYPSAYVCHFKAQLWQKYGFLKITQLFVRFPITFMPIDIWT